MTSLQVAPRHYLDNTVSAIETLATTPSPAKELKEIRQDFLTMAEFFQHETQCWTLTPELVKLIWHTEYDVKLFETIRLPHPAIAVEYDFDNQSLGLPMPTGNHHVMPRRCTIVIDRQQDVVDDLLFYQFYGPLRDKQEFGITPYTTILDYVELPQLVTKFNQVGADRNYKVPIRLTGLVESMTIDDMAFAQGISKEKLINTLLAEAPMIDDIRIVLGLLQLLNCRNVPIQKIEPPIKVNKKRAKHGKPLLRPYMTIKLPRPANTDRPTCTKKTSQSPVPHVRRGHLRHQWYSSLQEYKYIWIKPTFVGARGPLHPRDVIVKA